MNKLLSDWKTLLAAFTLSALYYHLSLDMETSTFLSIGLDLVLGFIGVAAFYCRMIVRGFREVGFI